MVRLAVYIALVLIVIVTGGCPRMVETNDRGEIARATLSPRSIDSSEELPAPSDSDAPDDGDASGEQETEDGLTGEEAEGADSETPVDDSLDNAETDEDADTDEMDETVSYDNSEVGETSADDRPADEEQLTDEVNPEADTASEIPAVDEPIVDEDLEEDIIEEEITEEAFEAPSFTPEPPTVKLSREAKRFAGSWQAVVFDFNGESEHATGDRFVVLSDTGSFEATALNRDGRIESGIWSKDEGTVSLSFGPAGDVKYDVDHAADNISIWHGPSGGAMFCIRLPDTATAMSPGERYESNFGPVEFSRSGPGYWKGSYGDPEGTLVLQNAGEFLYGTWEQGELAGYAIFEFNQRGFEGFWWYSGQTSFGGEWQGEQ